MIDRPSDPHPRSRSLGKDRKDKTAVMVKWLRWLSSEGFWAHPRRWGQEVSILLGGDTGVDLSHAGGIISLSWPGNASVELEEGVRGAYFEYSE